MNLTLAANIYTRGGTIQVRSIPVVMADRPELRDEWLIRGDCWPFQFQINLDGAPYDLTGKTVTMDIVIPLDVDPTITLTLASVGSASDGLVSGIVGASDSSIAPIGSYVSTVKIDSEPIADFRVFVVDDVNK